ncbi:SRPBCC family protein [Parasphingopyxis algicola]|uniref:SRPBCC family protein n=1 Tax=Parasphingopyxis algicola TaxID=2026624 RepID=UPI0015A02FE4|nr:SRPBCC family protein [Parasphingopyxis algicola]QLC24631.1 SRPBCC family protein [Parasphingopyxis algicola]
MPVVQVDHVFALPAGELWDLIGDFGDIGKWSGRPPEACVQEGEGIGALRTLTLEDGRTIIDRLEAQGKRSYSYSIVEAPLPYEYYRATMAVEPIDEGSSKLSWTGEFRPKGMTDERGEEFTRNMYLMGIGLMEKTLARRSASGPES